MKIMYINIGQCFIHNCKHGLESASVLCDYHYNLTAKLTHYIPYTNRKFIGYLFTSQLIVTAIENIQRYTGEHV